MDVAEPRKKRLTWGDIPGALELVSDSLLSLVVVLADEQLVVVVVACC